MAHYLRLVGLFIKTGVQNETSFRANFAVNLLNTVLTLVAGIAGVAILFSQIETMQGWTFAQTLTLLGIYLMVGALRNACVGPSLDALGGLYGEVAQGTFDFTLLKPVQTQFLVSFRTWRVWAFGDLVLSLVVVGIGLVQLGSQVSLANLIAFVVALAVSLTIVYAIVLLLASGIFWYQGVPLLWVFDSVFPMGRYPVGIYPGWLRLVLTWVIPVAFITTVPVEALTRPLIATTLLGGVAMAAGLVILASLVFRASLRRYVSASS